MITDHQIHFQYEGSDVLGRYRPILIFDYQSDPYRSLLLMYQNGDEDDFRDILLNLTQINLTPTTM
jgi:hypothetical protein